MAEENKDQNAEELKNQAANQESSSPEEPQKTTDSKPGVVPPRDEVILEKSEVGETKPEVDEKIEVPDTEEVREKVEERNQEEVKTPIEDFDWDAIDQSEDNYDKEQRNKLEEQYEQTLSEIAEHEVLDGIIVSKNQKEVVVNIGYKSDGVVPLNELRHNPDLKVGDQIEVYVENQEDPNGQLILSHRKARTLRAWERINEAYDKDEIIRGHVKSRTKGGLIADVFGIEAFLPGSQIDVKPIRDYDMYVNKSMEFKVVKINHEYKNVVVSHKALIEDELEQQRAEIIAKLEKGQVLEGTVKNITSYGVFVDLGGVDGLVHITDLSWGRINHPEEVVELDQKIKVVILDFDENKKRIALGLKQLTPHPWDALEENLKVGDKVKGKVVVLADYGAFVEIQPGVEGLIHVSEMSWSQHLRTAHDFLKVGDEVEAVILTLDREERKMSLGMKQLIPDPWENIETKYPVNSKHKAVVRNFTNFGIFVELEEGVDGLIHISDLSWSKKIKHPAEFTQIGEEIDVIVLDVDKENRRLSLGHKQLEENPWDVFETVFTIGSIHKGTIISRNDKGAVVTLPYGVEGFAPARHMKKEDGSDVMEDTIDFKVIEFSKENKRIVLSHSRIHEDEQAQEKAKERSTKAKEGKATQKAVKKLKDSAEKATLGDLDALANLKNEMEKDEKNTARKKASEIEKKEKEKEAKRAEAKAKKEAEEKKETAEATTEEKVEEKAEEKAEPKAEKEEKAETKAKEKAEPKKEEKAEPKAEEKAEPKKEEKAEPKAEEKKAEESKKDDSTDEEKKEDK
ncbi:MAG TPA: 30S ribosomal protein S1 [Bacteroidales bacterium]|nr:30S ribosomal protein S1 [Bacteroidales bacterium]